MTLMAQTDTPLGPVLLACDGAALTGLWLQGQRYFPHALLERAEFDPGHPLFRRASAWLERYFSGGRPTPQELPLAPDGTDFQCRVWALLCEIPYGETTTYGRLAIQLGGTCRSAQAVGNAVGRNPISIVIPCHRVLGSNGGLCGYAGGLERKRWLLCHEGAWKR